MLGVLDGIRVAAFTHFAAGPLTAQFLGAFGADVIKVEAPFGDFNRHGIRDVAGAMAGAFKTLSCEDAMAACREFGIWVAPVRSVAEALEDPAVKARGIVREAVSSYAGSHRVVVEPLHMSESPIEFSRPAPDLGEHTREVLAELGYSADEIAAMETRGAAKACV